MYGWDGVYDGIYWWIYGFMGLGMTKGGINIPWRNGNGLRFRIGRLELAFIY